MEKILSIPKPHIQHTHNVFISFATTETLNYVQFYAQHNTLLSSLRFFLNTLLTDAQTKPTK